MTNRELVEILMARDEREDLRHAYLYDMWFHTAVDMIRQLPGDDAAVIDVLMSGMAKLGEELNTVKDRLVECEKRRIAPERRGAF